MDEEVKSPREEGDDSASSSPSQSLPVRPFWCPSQLVFHPYSPLQDSNRTSRALQAGVRRPLVTRLTKGIVETYQTCNPEFKYAEELNPKRFLTSPSDGVLNDGHDNANSDLILYVNFVFVNSRRRLRYIVKDVLGHGTFGQVAKCWVPETNSFVALKIIKNQPAYYQQSLVEVSLLTALNTKFDPEDQHHIVRIYDHFVFQRHLCISFEMLDTNLYELIKLNNFRGLSMSIVQLFSKQILCGLALMKEAAIIHCDLKPENILLCASVKPAEVKIIDFGSACMEDRTVYSYIQSRYYRSPEVLLGYQYSTAIDMWSFGCIVAELFLGLPLFPGASEYDLLKRMIRILGGEPPDYVLKEAKNTNKFFKYAGGISNGSRSSYQTLTPEEYEARDKKKPVIGKEYFNYMNLEGIVAAYPYRKNLSEEDISKEKHMRLALIDFLKGLVEFDPQKRWSPIQASKHPFLTGEPFTSPYKPPQETQRLPVSHNFNVDHHPGGGHWFAAGLSPNVQGRNMTTQTSTHFQMVPYAQSSSYGSLGSYGSYGDHTGFGSSHGSYGDNFNAFAYYSPGGPSGMNIYAQGVAMVGSSPDARRRMIHRSQALGASPSTVGFAPLPLGASPSQHTPPSSYNYVSGSPGHYGSTSPARGCFQGSPLGRGVAASQFTRRRSSGYPTNIPLHEGPSSSNSQFQCNDGAGSLPAENSAHIPSGLPLHMSPNSNVPSMRHLGGGAGVSAEYSSPVTGSFSHGSVPQFSPKKGTAHDKHEPGFPLLDPGNWDPHYSDDLLLQEGGFDDSAIASQFQGSLNITQAPVSVETSTGIGRFNHGFSGSLTNLVPRPNGPLQAFPQATGPPPPAYGHSMSAAFMPHFNPNSPIRFGQHPIQQFSHGGSSAPNTGEGFQNKLQRNTFSFNTGAPVSSIGGSSSNATSWGRRTNYSVSNVQPSSHGRNDYSRIS